MEYNSRFKTILILCIVLFLSFYAISACSRRENKSSLSLSVVSNAIIESQTNMPVLTALNADDTSFSEYIEHFYQISTEKCSDGIILLADGVCAYEIAVLRFNNEQSANEAQTILFSYLKMRLQDFDGYLPEQAQIVKQGRIARAGTVVALLIVPNSEIAEHAFYDITNKRGPSTHEEKAPLQTTQSAIQPLPTQTSVSARESVPASSIKEQIDSTPAPTTPDNIQDNNDAVSTSDALLSPPSPEIEGLPVPQPSIDVDIYDHDAVLAAWETGDTSNLSKKNYAILQAASNVLSELTTEEMTPYERELAIHDWMITNAQFDYYNVSHHPEDVPGPDNENPYGFFFDGKGVCYGYASTFQLFMDMTDIPCLSVKGLAGSEQAPHIWNIIQLDGEWYFVDVSWDDPLVSYVLSNERTHQYFNVTSSFLRSERHIWDETEVPEARGTKYAWIPQQ